MTKCKTCNEPIKGDYISSTNIGYIKMGKNGKKPIKRGETSYFHPQCKKKQRLTKEQLIDNWENGYFRMNMEDEV